MSFILSNFTNTRTNPSTTPSEFAYVTTDNMSTVLSTGYFNKLFQIVRPKDLILVTASDATSYVKVTGNEDKVVTVADGVNI
jgi:hypothetical protein